MELPAGSRVLCRRLAFKSRLGFGKYPDLTVQDILNVKEHEYLIWLYYNANMIDFLDEVKQEIGITEIIPKPGKDPELGRKIIKQRNRESWRNMTEEERKLRHYKRHTLQKRADMGRLRAAKNDEIHENRKCILQAINHNNYYKNGNK